MNSLINITQNNGQLVVSSKEVSDNFGKEHRNVLRNIDDLIHTSNAAAGNFIRTTYRGGNGHMNPVYLMNRDGFTLLVMGFTGPGATEWKMKYIQAFNEMESRLKNAAALQAERQQRKDRSHEVTAQLVSATNERARLFLRIAELTSNPTEREDCLSRAKSALIGSDLVPANN